MYQNLSLMKRLLLIALPIIAYFFVDAQCTPDLSITQPGVYPEQPDTAFADVPYDFSFQILALKDTAVVFAGQNLNATIDSVKVNNVIGLPSGFEYICNPSSCVFTWRDVGCINVKGNPTQSQAGVYDLEIATTAYARAGILALPVPDTTEGYQLVIKGDGSASIFDLSGTLVSIYPNPSTTGNFLITSQVPITKLRILDIQGKEVTCEAIANKKSTELNLEFAPKGLYYLEAQIGDKIVTKKLVR